MKAGRIIVAALVATIGLTSVAAARPDATKQRVQIDMKIHPKTTFVLTPLQSGAIGNDMGKHSCDGEPTKRTAYRDGQEAYPWDCVAWTFTGKRGTLVLRSRFTWIEVEGAYNIATGTWKVVRGTGQYARITGGGRIAQVGAPKIALARYQGYMTSP